jgi:hypothetical protein
MCEWEVIGFKRVFDAANGFGDQPDIAANIADLGGTAQSVLGFWPKYSATIHKAE